jgi:hypothetical protein
MSELSNMSRTSPSLLYVPQATALSASKTPSLARILSMTLLAFSARSSLPHGRVG